MRGVAELQEPVRSAARAGQQHAELRATLAQLALRVPWEHAHGTFTFKYIYGHYNMCIVLSVR